MLMIRFSLAFAIVIWGFNVASKAASTAGLGLAWHAAIGACAGLLVPALLESFERRVRADERAKADAAAGANRRRITWDIPEEIAGEIASASLLLRLTRPPSEADEAAPIPPEVH